MCVFGSVIGVVLFSSWVGSDYGFGLVFGFCLFETSKVEKVISNE